MFSGAYSWGAAGSTVWDHSCGTVTGDAAEVDESGEDDDILTAVVTAAEVESGEEDDSSTVAFRSRRLEKRLVNLRLRDEPDADREFMVPALR